MSKKKILSESQIRRFMGLAGISSLTDGYISRGSGANLSQLGLSEEGEEMEMDVAMAEEPPMDEPEMEEPMDEPVGDLSVADVESALADALEAMASELSGALPGVELSVDSEEELPVEEPLEEPPMDELPGEEEEMGMSGVYEEVSTDVEVVDTDAIVKEVYRRVAKRLNKMVKDNK